MIDMYFEVIMKLYVTSRHKANRINIKTKLFSLEKTEFKVHINRKILYLWVRHLFFVLFFCLNATFNGLFVVVKRV